MFQRGTDGRQVGQAGDGAIDGFRPAVERRQRQQRLAVRRRHGSGGLGQPRDILVAQQRQQFGFGIARQTGRFDQGAEDADMAEVDARQRQLDPVESRRHQADDFEVGFDAGITIQFGPQLDLLAAGRNVGRQGMQGAAAITQARDTLMVEQMRVDTGRLRRHVGADAHGPPRQLIDQLEGAQVQVLAGAGQQGIKVFEHRRHDVLEAAHAEMIEQIAPQGFDARRFGRQGIGNVFRKQPVHEKTISRTSPISIEVSPMKRI